MTGRDGLLVLDKPAGPTSHDMVAAMRRLLRQRRIGHAGTLDPFATGVLPLLLGRATRLSRFLSGGRKEYEGTILLGVATDTYDRDGAVVTSAETAGLTGEAVRGAAAGFRGRLLQTPPVYSARKILGRPMHALARAGEAPPARPTWVEIHRFEVTGLRLPEVDFRCETSAGTYVRSIAHDLGQALGCGGHLVALRRLRAAGLGIELAVTPSAVEAAAAEGRLDPLILPMSGIDLGIPTVRVGPAGREAMRAGRPLSAGDLSVPWPDDPAADAAEESPFRILDAAGELLGVATLSAGGGAGPALNPRIVLLT